MMTTMMIFFCSVAADWDAILDLPQEKTEPFAVFSSSHVVLSLTASINDNNNKYATTNNIVSEYQNSVLEPGNNDDATVDVHHNDNNSSSST